MTGFLSGTELTNAIKEILAEPNSRSAVAFWGRGSENWVTGKGARVIANLRMGGTNPYALQMVDADKRQNDVLHAKVFIGSTRAVVASANASANGLALEGLEQRGWVEAGVRLDQIEEVCEWFEDLWASAQAISERDWARARDLWSLRTLSRPPLASFASFDPSSDRVPLVVWVNDAAEWTTDTEAVFDQTGIGSEQAEARVGEGLTIEDASDVRVAAKRWVMFWTKRADGRPAKRPRPWLTLMSDVVVRGGFAWVGSDESHDVLLAAETPPDPPFDTADPSFLAAFDAVISRRAFALLLEDDVPGVGWYAPREPLIRKFWTAVKEEYDRKTDPPLASPVDPAG